ncbi:hypothetical protein RHMOL_Rhmol01G0368000 [Rhododendron molle]|uniref:Uncharacterized protein n=1 Tax=Rhododendron molle TaxID=49168 RepID=A0ACC0QCR4_RHOML|nr:hypothetical protein RHMOL_Rhmol01G0368000 [Rhododendron molle]
MIGKSLRVLFMTQQHQTVIVGCKAMLWDLLMDMMKDFMDTLKLVRTTKPMLLSLQQRLICSNSAFRS